MPKRQKIAIVYCTIIICLILISSCTREKPASLDTPSSSVTPSATKITFLATAANAAEATLFPQIATATAKAENTISVATAYAASTQSAATINAESTKSAVERVARTQTARAQITPSFPSASNISDSNLTSYWGVFIYFCVLGFIVLLISWSRIDRIDFEPHVFFAFWLTPQLFLKSIAGKIDGTEDNATENMLVRRIKSIDFVLIRMFGPVIIMGLLLLIMFFGCLTLLAGMENVGLSIVLVGVLLILLAIPLTHLGDICGRILGNAFYQALLQFPSSERPERELVVLAWRYTLLNYGVLLSPFLAGIVIGIYLPWPNAIACGILLVAGIVVLWGRMSLVFPGSLPRILISLPRSILELLVIYFQGYSQVQWDYIKLSDKVKDRLGIAVNRLAGISFLTLIMLVMGSSILPFSFSYQSQQLYMQGLNQIPPLISAIMSHFADWYLPYLWFKTGDGIEFDAIIIATGMIVLGLLMGLSAQVFYNSFEKVTRAKDIQGYFYAATIKQNKSETIIRWSLPVTIIENIVLVYALLFWRALILAGMSVALDQQVVTITDLLIFLFLVIRIPVSLSPMIRRMKEVQLGWKWISLPLSYLMKFVNLLAALLIMVSLYGSLFLTIVELSPDQVILFSGDYSNLGVKELAIYRKIQALNPVSASNLATVMLANPDLLKMLVLVVGIILIAVPFEVKRRSSFPNSAFGTLNAPKIFKGMLYTLIMTWGVAFVTSVLFVLFFLWLPGDMRLDPLIQTGVTFAYIGIIGCFLIFEIAWVIGSNWINAFLLILVGVGYLPIQLIRETSRGLLKIITGIGVIATDIFELPESLIRRTKIIFHTPRSGIIFLVSSIKEMIQRIREINIRSVSKTRVTELLGTTHLIIRDLHNVIIFLFFPSQRHQRNGAKWMSFLQKMGGDSFICGRFRLFQVMLFLMIDTLLTMAWTWLPTPVGLLLGSPLINLPRQIMFGIWVDRLLLITTSVFWGGFLSILYFILNSPQLMIRNRVYSDIPRFAGTLIMCAVWSHIVVTLLHIGIVLFIPMIALGGQGDYQNIANYPALVTTLVVLQDMLFLVGFFYLSKSTLQIRTRLISSKFKTAWLDLTQQSNNWIVLLREGIIAFWSLVKSGQSPKGNAWLFYGGIAQIGSLSLGFVVIVGRVWLQGLTSPILLQNSVTLFHDTIFTVAWLGVMGLVTAIWALPGIYEEIFIWPINPLQHSLGLFIRSLDPTGITLVAKPWKMFRNMFVPHWVLFPGYRMLVLNLWTWLFVADGFVALVCRPLVYLLASTGRPIAFLFIEIASAAILGSMIAARLVRVIPVVITATILALTIGSMLFYESGFVLPTFIVGLGISLIILTVNIVRRLRRSTKKSNFSTLPIRLASEWEIYEAFITLDKFDLIYSSEKKLELGNQFMKFVATCDPLTLTAGEIYNHTNTNPYLQSLALYMHVSRQLAQDLNNQILTSFSVDEIDLRKLYSYKQLVEAATLVEMRMNGSKLDNVLVILAHLRRSGLLHDAESILQQTQSWRGLPLPKSIDLPNIAPDPVPDSLELDPEVKNVINIYCQPEVDSLPILQVLGSWHNESTAAEELYRVHQSLLKMQSTFTVSMIVGLLNKVPDQETTVGEIVSTEDTSTSWFEPVIGNKGFRFLMDLASPFKELAQVATNLREAQSLKGMEQFASLTASLQHLQRIDLSLEESVCEPEKTVLKKIVDQWRRIITEEMSNISHPPSNIEVFLETSELFWVDQETVAVVVANRGDGSARDIRVDLLPGEGYSVLRPREAIRQSLLHGQYETRAEFLVRFNAQKDVDLEFEIHFSDIKRTNSVINRVEHLEFRKSSERNTPVEFEKWADPYVFGPPIKTPGLFKGRLDIMQAIDFSFDSATENHIVMLYGQRRMGKTSILWQLDYQFRGKGHFFPILIDVQTITTPRLAGFIWELARSIWNNLPEEGKLTIPRPEYSMYSLGPGRTLIEEFIPSVVACLRKLDCKLILLFDEFDIIYQNADYPEQDLLQIQRIIRGLVQSDKAVGLVYVGTHRLREMAVLYPQAPLFNLAKTIEVSFLDNESAEQLITLPSKGMLDFDHNAVKRLMRISGNHPFYLQLLCSTIFNQARSEKRYFVGLSAVNQAVDDLLDQGASGLDFLWSESTQAQQLVLTAFAGIADDENTLVTPDEIQRELKNASVPSQEESTLKVLDQLTNSKIIKQKDGQYCFTVGLLRLWLRRHKSLKTVKSEMVSKNRQMVGG